jgi:hypothetical protein
MKSRGAGFYRQISNRGLDCENLDRTTRLRGRHYHRAHQRAPPLGRNSREDTRAPTQGSFTLTASLPGPEPSTGLEPRVAALDVRKLPQDAASPNPGLGKNGGGAVQTGPPPAEATRSSGRPAMPWRMV